MWSKRINPWIWSVLGLALALVLVLLLRPQAPQVSPAPTEQPPQTQPDPAFLAAENTMDPEGSVWLDLDDDGYTLSWQPGQNAQRYRVTLSNGDDTLFSCVTEEPFCQLPGDLEPGLLLTVASERDYPGGVRSGEAALRLPLGDLRLGLGERVFGLDRRTMKLTAGLTALNSCNIQLTVNGQEAGETALSAVSHRNICLQLPVPQPDEPVLVEYTLTRAAGRARLSLTGQLCSFAWEDLYTDELGLTASLIDDNQYVLSWADTCSEGYRVSVSADGGAFYELARLDGSTRSFRTDHLDPFTDYTFQVEGRVSAQVEISTDERLTFATVWPLMDLELYIQPGDGESVGTVPAGTALCVIREKDSFFRVRWEDGYYWLDGRYCMVNLPDYIGNLCSYNITNSYDSIYMVHGCGIDAVTGTVISGYENVLLEDGKQLVPLIWPAAQKLIRAAHTAAEYGYRFRLYDTFRPRQATLSIYDLTSRILQDPIPESNWFGQPVEDVDLLSWDPDEVEMETTPEGETVPSEPAVLTYEIFMTDDGRYAMGNFLAVGISNHNLGIAMDMTLEDMEGNVLSMQTDIHDLSWYSEVNRNNDNAAFLRELMTQAGFGALRSEWWHFQDEQARDELGLKNLYRGVDARCWVLDDNGWRYRLEDGSFLWGCTQEVDGSSYTFDDNGYVVLSQNG